MLARTPKLLADFDFARFRGVSRTSAKYVLRIIEKYSISKKKFIKNEFCIEELGHFENRWILKKLLNLQNIWKHKRFTIGFPIGKYPDLYGFRRFSSFFSSIDFENDLTPR